MTPNKSADTAGLYLDQSGQTLYEVKTSTINKTFNN